jgi:hypothetical protein
MGTGRKPGRKAQGEVYCPKHPMTVMVLVCPSCRGAEGGKATARKHTHAQLAAWGRMGGRPKKKSKKKKRSRS